MMAALSCGRLNKLGIHLVRSSCAGFPIGPMLERLRSMMSASKPLKLQRARFAGGSAELLRPPNVFERFRESLGGYNRH